MSPTKEQLQISFVLQLLNGNVETLAAQLAETTIKLREAEAENAKLKADLEKLQPTQPPAQP
jgi:dynactin complex subunit